MGGNMSAKAAVRQSGNVTIIDLSGRITLGEGCGLLRSTVKDLVGAGHNKILLNLKEVSYIDSAGLGEMVGLYASVTNMGGEVETAQRVQSKVHDLPPNPPSYSRFSSLTRTKTKR